MPQVEDGRPEDAAGAAPEGGAPAAVPAETAQSHAPAPQDVAPPSGDQPRKRRRRRRRRKHPPGTAPGSAAVPAPDAAPSIEAPLPQGEAAPAAMPSGEPPQAAATASAPSGEQPRKRRRRRRRKPRTAEGAVPVSGAAAQAADPASAAAAPGGAPRPPRPREPRRERRGDENRRGDTAGPRRERDAGPRRDGDAGPRRDGDAGPRRDRDAGPRRDRFRDKEQRGPGTRPHGKGGGRFDRKPERVIYSFETVVDRGFEEVPDPANEGATRRVDWTIAKRTVAERVSGKLVSAVYILRRDGAATEFSQLSATRAAVNKTIVHPEKLTRPKTDYASGKK